MKWNTCLRSLFLGAIVSILIVPAWARQSGQTGAANGAGSSSSAGGTGRNPGGNTTNNPTDRTGTNINKNPANTNTNPNGNRDPEGQFRRPASVEVTGNVVLDDGSAPPMGVVIQRSCSGSLQKVADVAPNGSFWFEVGGVNRTVIADASESGPGNRVGMMGIPRGFSQFDTAAMTGLVGCELRAELGGYRSNVILITSRATIGPTDVGTIVLYPAQRIGGTTVSVTDLSAPKDAKKALARAAKAAQKGKTEEAEKNLESALTIYPKYADAWFQLGLIYEQAHRVADARNAFSKALESDGKFVRPYIELARLAATEQKWQETLDLSGQALALDPLDFPDGFYLNALANYYLKNWDLAEGSLRRVHRLDSNHRLPQSHLLLAGILDRKRDLAGEAEQLRFYLKYAPQAANSADVRARLQDLEKAPDSAKR